jgi:hypothetical protein
MQLSFDLAERRDVLIKEMKYCLRASENLFESWKKILEEELWIEFPSPRAFLEFHFEEIRENFEAGGNELSASRKYQIKQALLNTATLQLEMKRTRINLPLPANERQARNLGGIGQEKHLLLNKWKQVHNTLEPEEITPAAIERISLPNAKHQRPDHKPWYVKEMRWDARVNDWRLTVWMPPRPEKGYPNGREFGNISFPVRHLLLNKWRPPLQKIEANVLNQQDIDEWKQLQQEPDGALNQPVHQFVLENLATILSEDERFSGVSLSEYLWFTLQKYNEIADSVQEWKDAHHEVIKEADHQKLFAKPSRKYLNMKIEEEDIAFKESYGEIRITMQDNMREATELTLHLQTLANKGIIELEEEEG